MTPRWRRRLAGVMTVVFIALWPISQLTWARGEPPTVLALSWMALILATASLWATTDVRVEEDRQKR